MAAAPTPMEATMPKLTDTQLIILSAAAQRDSGALLPLPKVPEIEPRTLTRAFRALLKRDLVAEQPAAPGRRIFAMLIRTRTAHPP